MTAVTFLIPVFNGMPFLPHAITTVLTQPQPWSMFIVDDGSTTSGLNTDREERISPDAGRGATRAPCLSSISNVAGGYS